MAPALTEPLSPSEKLSNTTATATPTPSTRANSRKFEDTTATTGTVATNLEFAVSGNTTNVLNNKNNNTNNNNNNSNNIITKRNRNSLNPITSTTALPTRITRSKDKDKDAEERAVEKAVVAPSHVLTEVASSANQKTNKSINNNINNNNNNNNNNEQMGLSATLNNNNNNNNNTTTTTNRKNNDSITEFVTECVKDTSTEQLLADLTDNFEETITAEICLRRQKLQDVDLDKAAKEGNSNNIARGSTQLPPHNNKNVTNDSFGGRAAETGGATPRVQLVLQQQHMEADNIGLKSVNLVRDTNVDNDTEIEYQTDEAAAQQEHNKDALPLQQTVAAAKDADACTNTDDTTAVKVAKATVNKQISPLSTAATTTATFAELPLINTDSTITASEIEDNLEERLSQLDGTATSSDLQENDDDDGTADTSVSSATVPATPPSTPTLQQLQLQQLQAQLQQTPPPYTPPPLPPSQSSTSPLPASTMTTAAVDASNPAIYTHTANTMQHQGVPTPQSSTSSPCVNNSTAATVNSSSGCGVGVAIGGSGGVSGSGPGGEIEDHDIEEMLKVLKGFDGTGGSDALCDLNVLFNEVYNYEEMNPTSSSSSQPVNAAAVKANSYKDVYADIEKKELTLQRKIDFMLRRLRKLQARYMCKHASEEIAGLFELSARLALTKSGGGGMGVVGSGVPDAPSATAAYGGDNYAATSSASSQPIISGRPSAATWHELRKTPVSSAQVCSMLRKLESAANAQQLHTGPPHTYASGLAIGAGGNNSLLHFKKSKKAAAQEAALAAAAAAAASSAKDFATVVVPHFDSNISEELSYVAGLLHTEMREVQTAIDSDATESSSGAESADEIVTYSNPIQQSLSITKRAAWRYSRDRAAIAARWSWLLSQIADLEIKIRQHSDLLQEVVRMKGPVVCDTDVAMNGYEGVATNANGGVNASADGGCSRTRGYVASQFRKRKLLQTYNIHAISKKAARPSTVKCGCQWPLSPCAVCTGRTDPTAMRDLPNTMMMSDRIALLDGGYHPVLSFPEDVSNAIHFEAIARVPEWQQRVMRCHVKSIAKGVWKSEREAAAAAGHVATAKRRYIKKKDRIADEKNAATATTTTALASAAGSNVATNAAATATTFNSGSAACTTTTPIGHTAGSSNGSSSGGGAMNVIRGRKNSSLGGGIGTAGGGGGVGGSGGNGIGTLSTSTTPHVANSMTKNAKRFLQQHGDAMHEPQLPLNDMHYNNNHYYVHQTGDYPPPPPPTMPQNYDPYNPSITQHSLLVSNITSGKNNKHRKYGTNSYYNNHHQQHQQLHNYNNNNNHYNNHNYNNNNNSSNYYNNINGGDMSFLCNNIKTDSWDSTRSRPSSPTPMSSIGNNYKYERSLDRKNRSSYDIDNIVIPYSVAAATRVEILPYKEIPTPKWRVIANEAVPSLSAADSGGQLDEDMEIEYTEDIIANTTVAADEAAVIKVKTDGDEQKFIDSNSKLLPLPNVDIKQQLTDVKCTAAKSNTKLSPLKVHKEKTEQQSTINKVEQISNVSEKATSPQEKLKVNNCKATIALNSPNKVHGIKRENVENLSATEGNDVNKMNNNNEIVEQPIAKKIKIENHFESPTRITKIFRKDCPAMTSKEIKSESTSSNVSQCFSDISQNIDADDVEMDDGVVEDITDDTMTLRHERALTEERRKFQTYLKFPWSTRSRANRRIDSRAESSGTNTPTPDPSSPAPRTPSVGGGDQESIPSPIAPSTPLNALEMISETGEPVPAKFNNMHNSSRSRRRTTSAKKEREFELRCSTPDPREFIAPYEPLNFPLSTEVYESLLCTMPMDYQENSLNEEYASNVRMNTRLRSNQRGGGGSINTTTRLKSKSTPTAVNSMNYNRKAQQRCPSGKGNSRNSSYDYSKVQPSAAAAAADEELEKTAQSHHGINNESSVADEDDDVPEFFADEDDYDDYPKHHLAPNDDDDDIRMICGTNSSGGRHDTNSRRGIFETQLNDFEAYVVGGRQRGRSGMDGDSDIDSSTPEPFQDDDPNDPEWKGESEERLRKKL